MQEGQEMARQPVFLSHSLPVDGPMQRDPGCVHYMICLAEASTKRNCGSFACNECPSRGLRPARAVVWEPPALPERTMTEEERQGRLKEGRPLEGYGGAGEETGRTPGREKPSLDAAGSRVPEGRTENRATRKRVPQEEEEEKEMRKHKCARCGKDAIKQTEEGVWLCWGDYTKETGKQAYPYRRPKRDKSKARTAGFVPIDDARRARLKVLPELLGIRPTPMAVKAGLERDILTRLAKHKNQMPLYVIDALEKTYGVRREWLLEGEGVEIKPEFQKSLPARKTPQSASIDEKGRGDLGDFHASMEALAKAAAGAFAGANPDPITQNDTCLQIDFAKHPGILLAVQKAAVSDFRSVEMQVLYLINKGLQAA
jgi:ribosomal protein L37AE/L43A